MRIAYITTQYATSQFLDGGLGTYVHKIAQHLAQREHDITVFYLTKHNREWNDGRVKVIEIRQLPFPHSLLRFKFLHPLLRILPAILLYLSAGRIARSFWKRHKESPFDLIHTSHLGAPGVRLCKNGKVPIVCRLSSITPLCRWAAGEKHLFWEYLHNWFEWKLVWDAEKVFCPSELIATFHYRLEAQKIPVIRTPIESFTIAEDDSIYQAELRSRPYLVFVGGIKRLKGIDCLADALPEFFSRHPETCIVLVGQDHPFPGGGTMLEYLYSKNKIFRENIIHLNPLPKSQLYPIMRHALAMVLPSRIDNYPNVCLESHALGVPVIGSTQSSIEEMVVHGETGFLFPNGDSNLLAETLSKFMELSEREREMMRSSIQTAMANIYREDRIQKLEAFYKQAIEDFSAQNMH